MTEVIVRALQEQGHYTCFNWSRNKPLKGIRWKLARAWGVCKSIWGLIRRGRRSSEVLYYPANSSWGLLYDIVFATLGRVFGYKLILHHHAYSYIDRYDWRMAIVNRLVGSQGAHAVHCQKMVDDYRAQYDTKATFLIVPPTIVSQDLGVRQRPLEEIPDPEEPLVLGFLSNLTLAKGLDLVLETFENLIDRGLNVRLVLAGPCMHEEALSLVRLVTERWPQQVEYRGPVYEEKKAQFYSDIDVFLFPTRYKNESWGIVLTESLASGCPVIANDRGCVSYIIRDGCGLIVSPEDDFVVCAVELIEQWFNDPGLHRKAIHQAIQRYHKLKLEAVEQLPEFVEGMRSLG